MKDDQLPECYIQANDDHYVCYVMEYEVEEEIDYDERVIDDIIEVIKTCRICGQRDVYYPL
jgi:hypothetical protein